MRQLNHHLIFFWGEGGEGPGLGVISLGPCWLVEPRSNWSLQGCERNWRPGLLRWRRQGAMSGGRRAVEMVDDPKALSWVVVSSIFFGIFTPNLGEDFQFELIFFQMG